MVRNDTGLSAKRLFGSMDKGSFDSCRLLGLSKSDCTKARRKKSKAKRIVRKRTKKIQGVKRKAVRNTNLI